MAENNAQQPEESDKDEHYISKTQAKRNVEALQDLGKELVQLSQNTLEKFNLDERLFDAILMAKSISSHSAKRRQLQLIGKIMRQIDAEPIRRQLEHYQNQHQQQTDEFHELEGWRDKLLQEGDRAVNDLLTKHPNLERTRLRQLIRNAQKESKQNKPPKSARQLFKYLKESINPSDD